MSSSPLRPVTEADAEAVAALFMEAFGDWRPTDAEEIRTWLRNEEITPENLRVLEIDGHVAGYGDVWLDDDVELDMAAPGHWDVFLDWAEQRGRDASLRRVRAFFPEGHELEGILEERGYRYWRSAFQMRIDFAERPDASLPDGFELRPYREEDAEPLRLGINEAFTSDPFFHAVSPSNFREFFLKSRGCDTGLWQIAWAGDELAGWALAFPCRGSDDTIGWVGNLGVRPPFRGRGLGSALLVQAFAALYDRGLRQAGLGVDAENPTGAVGLYERAGMRRVLRQDNWVKDV
ncbi:MAG TPA: GNAT family N-acetyltransferase [Gaiellaceae bacterium]|nr:GNAT family N-acetyltransferase [Gaiellaceae bacterium]